MQLFDVLWGAVGIAGNAISVMSNAAYNAIGTMGTQAVEVMSGVVKMTGLG